jgi:hypothetical protein
MIGVRARQATDIVTRDLAVDLTTFSRKKLGKNGVEVRFEAYWRRFFER